MSSEARALSLVLLVCAGTVWAQTAPPPAAVGAKVVFRDGRNRVLLIFDENRQAWEVPGTSHQGSLTVQQLVAGIADDLGIAAERATLRGLFTYHNSQTGRTILRPYFDARVRRIVDEQKFQAARLRWFTLRDAVSAVPYPASVRILEKILSEPRHVWGGAFEEWGYTSPMTPETKITFRVVEDFYRLR